MKSNNILFNNLFYIFSQINLRNEDIEMKIVALFFLLFPILTFSQVTIQLERIPLNTPENSQLYIVGNFNNWQPGDSVYRLKKNANNYYLIEINSTLKELEFKFVRNNSWETVEGDVNGYDIPNRKCKVSDTTIILSIATCYMPGFHHV